MSFLKYQNSNSLWTWTSNFACRHTSGNAYPIATLNTESTARKGKMSHCLIFIGKKQVSAEQTFTQCLQTDCLMLPTFQISREGKLMLYSGKSSDQTFWHTFCLPGSRSYDLAHERMWSLWPAEGRVSGNSLLLQCQCLVIYFQPRQLQRKLWIHCIHHPYQLWEREEGKALSMERLAVSTGAV